MFWLALFHCVTLLDYDLKNNLTNPSLLVWKLFQTGTGCKAILHSLLTPHFVAA